MNRLKNIEEVFSDKERMELIWVDKGIKPVGEIKDNTAKCKDLLENIGFYIGFYSNRVLYSKEQKPIIELKEAINDSNYDKEGRFWGYPLCCSQYFSELKRKGVNPYEENLNTVRNRLKIRQFVPTYFSSYVLCPTCISTRDSPSGRLEDKMGKALKSEDYYLYEKFRSEANGRVVCLQGADGKDIIVWDYRK